MACPVNNGGCVRGGEPRAGQAVGEISTLQISGALAAGRTRARGGDGVIGWSLWGESAVERCVVRREVDCVEDWVWCSFWLLILFSTVIRPGVDGRWPLHAGSAPFGCCCGP